MIVNILFLTAALIYYTFLMVALNVLECETQYKIGFNLIMWLFTDQIDLNNFSYFVMQVSTVNS